MDRRRFFKPPKGVTLTEPAVEKTALGALVVRGVLMPAGERFAATLWAISGRPGTKGAPVEQVIYTDRGPYRTGLTVGELQRQLGW